MACYSVQRSFTSTGYEGIALPVVASQRGSLNKPENGLRDPAIYREGDHLYLLYTVESQRGIAVAELRKRGTAAAARQSG